MSTLSTPTRPAGEPPAAGWRAVPWRPVAIFLAVTFGASWLPWIPVIFAEVGMEGGLYGTDAGVGSLVVGGLSMLTPTLGAIAAVRWGRRPNLLPKAGLVLRPARRVLSYCVLAMAIFSALYAATLSLGALFGMFHFDLTGWSGLRESLELGPADPVVGPVLLHTLFLFVAGMPLIIGEEIGWRGYLEPQLEPLGMLRMVLFSGFVWGIWHLPAVFLADRDPVVYLVSYLVDCTVAGALLCWLRMRSGSIWPAVIGHAAISSFPGPVAVIWLADASREHDVFAVDSLGGWISWILKAALIGVIVLLGGFRPWRPADDSAVSAR